MSPLRQEGMVVCRWCAGQISPPRRTFCSASCVHNYRLRTSVSYMRDQIYLRDKGVCALCKIDTNMHARTLRRLQRELDHTPSSQLQEQISSLRSELKLAKNRKVHFRRWGGGLWDADHILPVCNGGGLCGLENMRTLCVKCHLSRGNRNPKF